MYEILFGSQNQSKKLQITSTSTAVSTSSPLLPPFKLPDNWDVEFRPRKDGRFDKYYYEPGTGRKFRSLGAIQNYLNGDINAPRKKLKPCNQENMAIIPSNFMRNSSSFGLPTGWVVQEKPRNNINYARTVDRTFIEPGTGKRFRSLASVERYIAEKNLCQATSNLGYYSFKSNPSFRLPYGWVVEEKPRNNINYIGRVDRYYIEPGTGKRFRSLMSVEKYIAEKKSSLGNHSPSSSSFGFDKAPTLNPRKPPGKVKWVLSPVESIWKPFIHDTPVSESLKREWSQAFVYTLYFS